MARLNISQILTLIEYSKTNNAEYLLLPVKAIKVQFSGRKQLISILEQTVLKLKNLGFGKVEIAEKLCLDVNVIETILDKYKMQGVIKDGKVATSFIDDINKGQAPSDDLIGYIFYSYITSSLIKNVFISENEYQRRKKVTVQQYDSNHIKFKRSVGDSNVCSAAIVKPPFNEIVPMKEIQQLDVLNAFPWDKNIKVENIFPTEDIYMQLKCRVNDRMDILVESPIYDPTTSVLYGKEDNTRENIADDLLTKQVEIAMGYANNSNLAERIKNIKLSKESSSAKISEVMKNLKKKSKAEVLLEYSNKLAEMPSLLERLVSVQMAFNCIKNSKDGEYDFYIAAYQLLEMAMFTCFSLNFRGSVPIDKLRDIEICSEIIGLKKEKASNLFRMVSKRRIEKLSENVGSIYESNKDTFEISVSVAACILCAVENEEHTFRNLSRRMPEFIEYIEILNDKVRNPIKHGDADKAAKVNYMNLYNGIRKIMKCLFPEYCIHKDDEYEDKDKTEVINNVLSDIDKKVKNQLDGLVVDFNIKAKLGNVFEAYYKHSPEFFAKVDVLLVAIFDAILKYAKEKNLDQEKVYSLFDESYTHNGKVIKKIISKHSNLDVNSMKIWRISSSKLKNIFSGKNVLSVKATFAIAALDVVGTNAIEKLFKEMPKLIQYTTFVISPDGRGHGRETDFTDESIDYKQLVDDLRTYCIALNYVLDDNEILRLDGGLL